jgi:F-type H+-transporting ATPase subunit gamma
MAQTQIISRRIRSVKNAKQITKAMEVVAASRMRRVQTAVNSSRQYADSATDIIRKLQPSQEAKQHPYFRPADKLDSLSRD